jgi:TRAP-type mannitol/chloroaromatic compound transport system substrate-binding protein
MKRRNLLIGAGAAAATAVAANFPAPAIAQGKRNFKMTLGFPKAFPGFGDYAVNMTKRLEAMSDGKWRFKVYGAGELVGPYEALDAAGRGTVDMYYAASYGFAAKNQAFNFFTCTPFGLSLIEHYAWMTHGGGQELADELHAKFNIKTFMAGQTYQQWGGWFNKKVEKPEDLRGLKIRIAGLGAEIYKKLGAAAVLISVADSQSAMASGAIDAIELNSPWVDQIVGLQKLAKYYYHPGWQEPHTPMDLGLNLDVWKSFSPREKEIFRSGAEARMMYNMGRHFVTNIDQLARLKRENPKVSVLQFPDDVLIALGKARKSVMEAEAAKDPLFKKIYESNQAFLMKAMTYTGAMEVPLFNVRKAIYG